VVFDHSATIIALPEYFNGVLYNGMLNYGSMGVDLFFVISGFIITIVSLQARSTAPRVSLYEYARRRIARIIPFLWVCVAVYASVRLLGRGKFEWGPYLNAVFLLPPGEVRPNVVWTLRHEALFYIVFALSFLGTRRRLWILGLWVFSPLMLLLFLNHPLRCGYWCSLSQFAFSPVNLEFAFGVMAGVCYLKYDRIRNLLSTQSLPWASVLACIVITQYLAAVFFRLSERSVLSALLLGALSTLALAAALPAPAPRSSISRIGKTLGDASYAIYLVHNLVLLIWYSLWIKLLGKSHPYAAQITGVIIAVILATIVHRYVERPLVKAAQQIGRHKALVPDAESAV